MGGNGSLSSKHLGSVTDNIAEERSSHVRLFGTWEPTSWCLRDVLFRCYMDADSRDVTSVVRRQHRVVAAISAAMFSGAIDAGVRS